MMVLLELLGILLGAIGFVGFIFHIIEYSVHKAMTKDNLGDTQDKAIKISFFKFIKIFRTIPWESDVHYKGSFFYYPHRDYMTKKCQVHASIIQFYGITYRITYITYFLFQIWCLKQYIKRYEQSQAVLFMNL